MGSFARTVRLIMRGLRDVRGIVRQVYVINSPRCKKILLDRYSHCVHNSWMKCNLLPFTEVQKNGCYTPFTAVTRVQIPSGTPILINALHGNPICIAIHRKYTLFRPDHTYNFALRGPLVGPESLSVGVQRHP